MVSVFIHSLACWCWALSLEQPSLLVYFLPCCWHLQGSKRQHAFSNVLNMPHARRQQLQSLRRLFDINVSLLQTLLFSATMPSALHEFAKAGLKDPEMVRLDTDTKISQELSTAFFTVRYHRTTALATASLA